MGCFRKVIVYLVLAALAAGLVLNLIVASSCEYMAAKKYNVQLGVFRFAVNDTSTEYNTNGECKEYDNLQNLEWQVEMARVCAIIAPVCGAILLLLVLITQCCSPIPCAGPIITLAYVGCHLGTALVWMIRLNDICDNQLGGCQWGDAAWCNVAAQIAYLAAAFLHRFLPDPKLAAETRRADKAEAELEKQRQDAANNNQAVPNPPPETHTSNNAGTNAQVQQLQTELDAQKQATASAENRAVAAESRANTLQTQFNTQAADLEQQRNLLAAATAASSTAAAAEAAKINQLNEKMAQKDKEIQQKEQELDQTQKELTEAKEDAEQQRNALAAATAASSTAATAEAVEIKKLKKKLKAQQEDLKKSQDLCEEQKAALAVATGVTSATATAEAMTIKELQQKIDQQNEELKALRQNTPSFTDAGNSMSAPPPEDPEVTVPVQQDVNAEIEEVRAKYEAQIEELEEENSVLKGLAAAGVASTATAGAEAAEIEKLQKQLEEQKEEYETKLKELQGDDDRLPVYKSSNFDAEDPDGNTSGEERKLQNYQAQMDQQKEDYEAKIKELEQQNEALKAATTATSTAAVGEAVELKQLKEELERQKEELASLKAGGAAEEPDMGSEKHDPPSVDPPTRNPMAVDPEMAEPTGAKGSSVVPADEKDAQILLLNEELARLRAELEDAKGNPTGTQENEAADPQLEDPPVVNLDVAQPGGVRGSLVAESPEEGAELEEAKGNPTGTQENEAADPHLEDPPVVNPDVAQPGGVRGSLVAEGPEDESPMQEEEEGGAADPPVEASDAAQPGGIRGSVVGTADETQVLEGQKQDSGEPSTDDPPAVNPDVEEPGGKRASMSVGDAINDKSQQT